MSNTDFINAGELAVGNHIYYPPHGCWCHVIKVYISENGKYLDFSAKVSDPRREGLIPKGSYVGRDCSGHLEITDTVSVIR